MSSAPQNKNIAQLIVYAMSIDGTLNIEEQRRVADTLQTIGMSELIADVTKILAQKPADFNIFGICAELLQSLEPEQQDQTEVFFRIIADVVAADRFVSIKEATFLSTIANQLNLSSNKAQDILKEVMAERRGRLEIAANALDKEVNEYLKELMNFKDSETTVTEVNSVTVAMQKGTTASEDELSRALALLGLNSSATLEEAEEVWKETIKNTDLKKMSMLGETFVSATINRLTRINNAYKTILQLKKPLN